MIAETRRGFVCASAGVDASNAPEPDTSCSSPSTPTLPRRPFASRSAAHRSRCGRHRRRLPSAARSERASSTWLSASPASTPLVDWRGHVDAAGHELRTTVIAVADEIASAAELVVGKLDGVPAAVVRGLEVGGLGSARRLVMPPSGTSFPRGHQHRCGDGGGTQVSGDTMCMRDAPMWRRIEMGRREGRRGRWSGGARTSASSARPPNPKVRARSADRRRRGKDACGFGRLPCPGPASRPSRPAGRHIAMTISITAGRKVVQGTSRVSFALDRPSDRIVFRLWPNMPVQRLVGARLDVRDVRVGGAGATATEPIRPHCRRAAGSTQANASAFR